MVHDWEVHINPVKESVANSPGGPWLRPRAGHHPAAMLLFIVDLHIGCPNQEGLVTTHVHIPGNVTGGSSPPRHPRRAGSVRCCKFLEILDPCVPALAWVVAYTKPEPKGSSSP